MQTLIQDDDVKPEVYPQNIIHAGVESRLEKKNPVGGRSLLQFGRYNVCWLAHAEVSGRVLAKKRRAERLDRRITGYCRSYHNQIASQTYPYHHRTHRRLIASVGKNRCCSDRPPGYCCLLLFTFFVFLCCGQFLRSGLSDRRVSRLSPAEGVCYKRFCAAAALLPVLRTETAPYRNCQNAIDVYNKTKRNSSSSSSSSSSWDLRDSDTANRTTALSLVS